ncbi:hypothetical protein [Pedobacter xixiisoli]|uniref:Uncharacterized protein n=1 Tax=Pedobacter xixiisoli TaxID=1476464 RepID=A0A285ZW71_9SPHI|nr:hypothetical protein [Pedobacter xixiisoli]SOD13894.1 hypothetical protein SAMN06297358_1296 [Pedobacter xixiisoli]
MLFQNFSWQDFLLVAVLLSVLWYGLVWLFFFRKKPVVVGDANRYDEEERSALVEEELLGKPVLAEGEKVVSSNDFGFSEPDQVEQLGVVADVQEQIKVSCRELESNLAKKEEFLSVLAGVLASYPVSLAARLPLEDFIREQLPFFISEEELDGLWL